MLKAILIALLVLGVGCAESPIRSDVDASPSGEVDAAGDLRRGDSDGLAQTDGAWPPPKAWAKSLGGTGNEVVFDAVMDKSGNLFLTGMFSETWSLDTGNLSASGKSDAFVLKLDTDGKVLWAAAAGGPERDAAYALSVSSSGNVYITGDYQGTAKFGTTSLTAKKTDIFVAKLGSAGKFEWATSLGGSEVEVSRGVAADGKGGAYVAGRFEGTASFGTKSLSASPKDKSNGFVARLDAGGKVLWAVAIGGSGEASCGDAVAGNDVLISGWFTKSVTIGSKSITSKGESDGFVARLDASGKTVWASAIAQGSGSGWGGELAFSGSNIVAAGMFRETADFGNKTLTSKGAINLYVTALDASGKVLWASTAGGDGDARANALAVGSAGDILITGTYFGKATFGSRSLTPKSNNGDVFVAKFGPSGKVLWAASAGGSETDTGFGIAASSANKKIYAAGDFGGTASFGTDKLTSLGQHDIFFWKIDVQ
jgi:hypothetical protein